MFLIGNVYNCNTCTKCLFETFFRSTAKLFMNAEEQYDQIFHSLSIFFLYRFLCIGKENVNNYV